MKIKDGTYITIQSWMRTEFNLKDKELILFALIYGFCQDNESKFNGSISYMSEWVGTSKSTIKRILRSLIEKGLIEKTNFIQNSITYYQYLAKGWGQNEPGGGQNDPGGGQNEPGGGQNEPGGGQNDPGGGVKMNPYNNSIYNIDNNTWKTDYNIYLDQLRTIYKETVNNQEWLEQQEIYYPRLDIELTLQKACTTFWATEAGWKHKKNKRNKEIDWKMTFNNALSLRQNWVYKEKD